MIIFDGNTTPIAAVVRALSFQKSSKLQSRSTASHLHTHANAFRANGASSYQPGASPLDTPGIGL